MSENTRRPRITAAIFFLSAYAASSMAIAQQGIVQMDFGDDRSDYANNGECDDPRFTGRGMSDTLMTDDMGRDATDCRELFKKGRVQLSPLFKDPVDASPIDYGDNKGDYADDNECDDIRFHTPEAASTLYMVGDIGHDASDCKAAVESGRASWQGAGADPVQRRLFD